MFLYPPHTQIIMNNFSYHCLALQNMQDKINYSKKLPNECCHHHSGFNYCTLLRCETSWQIIALFLELSYK